MQAGSWLCAGRLTARSHRRTVRTGTGGTRDSTSGSSVRWTSLPRPTGSSLVQGYEGYGSVVLVQHRAGYATLYAHLSRALVRVGEHVLQGGRIGLAGCTGWCTGTHLHFEVRYRNVAIDPSLLIVG